METGHSFALIATQTPRTKKTPHALDGIEGVSKVTDGTDQAISVCQKDRFSDTAPKPQRKRSGKRKEVSFD
jgi:hypothetical protein